MGFCWSTTGAGLYLNPQGEVILSELVKCELRSLSALAGVTPKPPLAETSCKFFVVLLIFILEGSKGLVKGSPFFLLSSRIKVYIIMYYLTAYYNSKKKLERQPRFYRAREGRVAREALRCATRCADLLRACAVAPIF